MKIWPVLFFLLVPALGLAQCPANPPLQLCNAVLETGSSLASPFTDTIGLSGANPAVPPATANSYITDTAFSVAGTRLLRVTAPGYDNRSAGATNASYHGGADNHYLAMSIDDSSFLIQDQSGANYFIAFNTSTFSATKIPCSFDATTGNIGQKGNCRSIAGDGSGQKYLITNTGPSPQSNVYQGDNPYAWKTANQLFILSAAEVTGSKVYKIDISPTISNGATPPTVLNSGNPVVDPYVSCLPGGTSASLTPLSLHIDANDNVIDGRLGVTQGSSFGFYYNQSSGHCYTITDAMNYLTDGGSSAALVFYQSDGTTPWGASPTITDAFHSTDVSLSGTYGIIVIPNSWDNDSTHCNASCNFIWQVGTNKIITAARSDGHGALEWTHFSKYRVTSSNIYTNDLWPYSGPSLTNRIVPAAWQDTGGTEDAHLDANPMTASEAQYGCGTTFLAQTFNNTTPGGVETIAGPMENEVFCFNNAGKVWRIAHLHTAGLMAAAGGLDFEGSQGYMSTSIDGKYMVTGSEWGCQLGTTNGLAISTWDKCRSDAFIVELTNATPIVPAPSSPINKGLLLAGN